MFDVEDTSANASPHGTTAETTTVAAVRNAEDDSSTAMPIVPIVPAVTTDNNGKAKDSAKISLRPFENTYNQVKAVSEPYRLFIYSLFICLFFFILKHSV